jgi:hypothetical protein
MDSLKNVVSFCKSTATIGKRINDLYRLYLNTQPAITLSAFEEALLRLDKTVIKDLQVKCKKYVQEHSGETNAKNYGNFIKSEEYITRKLWDRLVGYQSRKKNKWVPGRDGSLVNPNWGTYTREHKTALIRRCTDSLILNDIIKNEEDMEVINEACIRADTLEEEKKLASVEVKKAQANVRLQKAFDYAKQRAALDRARETTPQKPDFKSMLPVNWDAMSKGERVDFAKKIQHKEFYKYILDLDKTLVDYLNSGKKTPGPSVNLYVNLFTFPSSANEEAKTLVKGLVEALNMMGRARLQYIELTEPPIIEIREVRR